MAPKRMIGLLIALLVAGMALGPHAAAQDRYAIATGGTGGVYYPYGGALASLLSSHLEDVSFEATVTSASVDNMFLIEDQDADLAFVLADTAYDALQGNDPFENPIPGRTLLTLYDNYTHIVVKGDSGINTVADLRGKRVSTGSPGSGTETIAFRVLEAAGLNYATDVSRQALGAAPSVDALKDGKIDAFFWSGGVPTGAVLDLANTPGRTLKILPNDDILPALQQKYSADLYYPITVSKTAYNGMESDVSVVGVANVLVVDERMSDQLAYEITRVLFDKQAELIQIHSEAKNLTLETAIVGSPVPFHPGAIQFYQEKGVWKG